MTEQLTENTNSNSTELSIKEQYILSIAYVLLSAILNGITSEMILDISEQIAASCNISKEFFISTFDCQYIQEAILEISQNYEIIGLNTIRQLSTNQSIIVK
jgi:hypothetical protein